MSRINRRAFLKLVGLTGISLTTTSCTDEKRSPAPPSPGATTNSDPTPTAERIEVTAATPKATPIAAPFSKSRVHITHWDNCEQVGDWLESEIQLFQQAYPWITIGRSQQPEIDQAIRQSYQNNNMPDVYIGGPSLFSQYESGQWLCQPISDFADFDEFKHTFPDPDIDFILGSNIFDEKTYTAPREIRTGWQSQVFVNLNLFEQYRIEKLPETDDEFIEAARKIATDSGGTAFGYGNGFGTGWMHTLFECLGAKSFKIGGRDWRDNRSKYAKNPAYQKLLEMLSILTSEGLLLPESGVVDDRELRTLFAENHVAMIHGHMSDTHEWRQTHPDFTNYTVLPPLRLGNQQEYTYYSQAGITGTPCYISSKSQYPEEAWLWFKWLHLPACGERWTQSGNGFSIFPASNKPENFPEQAWEDYLNLHAELNRVEPYPPARNLDCYKLIIQPAANSFAALTQAVYDYWLTEESITEQLAQLEIDEDANWQAALLQAQANGAKIDESDFIFPDWEPLNDYTYRET